MALPSPCRFFRPCRPRSQNCLQKAPAMNCLPARKIHQKVRLLLLHRLRRASPRPRARIQKRRLLSTIQGRSRQRRQSKRRNLTLARRKSQRRTQPDRNQMRRKTFRKYHLSISRLRVSCRRANTKQSFFPTTLPRRPRSHRRMTQFMLHRWLPRTPRSQSLIGSLLSLPW